MAARVPARLSAAEGRKFALTVGGAFLALALVAWWRGRAHISLVTGLIGVALLVAGLLIPGRLTLVYRIWTVLGQALSRITTPLFLGIVYYVVLTPVGLLMRLFGRRILVRPASAGSFWLSREAAARQRKDMERQF